MVGVRKVVGATNTPDTIVLTLQNNYASFPGIINIAGLTNYASNAAAITGGLVAGDVYRNSDNLCVVH